jgi:large subunit ribosomal protein L32
VPCECGAVFKEKNVLCPKCYSQIIAETNSIKDKILSALKLDPVDKEVVVLYEGEKSQAPLEFWNGKRIVEMEKPRPQFFSKNLLQKTTQPNANTKEVEISSTIELKPKNIA